MRIIKRNYTTTFFILVAATLLSLSSCRTSRVVATREIKPMTADKILKRLKKESPDYDVYSAKKVSVDIDNNGERNTFSAQFRIKRNEQMLFSMKKMVPLGRALITTDSLLLVNYYDKYYMRGDIGSIQKMFGIDIDYDLLQTMFTADLTSLFGAEFFDKDLIAFIDSEMYRIDSEFNRKIRQALSKGSDRRLNRYMKRMEDHEFLDFSIWIDPEYFVLRKIEIKDIKHGRNLTLRYDEFQLVEHNLFPQKISLNYYEKSKTIDLVLNLSKLSINDDSDFSFSIPEKYDQYKFK